MTAHTVDELIAAFNQAWADPAVAAVILTGAGDKAFCTGGDTKQRAETGDYGPSATGIFQIDNLHRVIRDIPKPVIAAVNGYAIGGGHVLHVLCDLTIAAEHGAVRPGRAAGRVVRRRVRVDVPGPGGGGEAGPGDLVPLPPLRRRHRRTVGPRQRRRPAPTGCSTRRRPGRPRSPRRARPPSSSSSGRSTSTPSTRPAWPTWRRAPWRCTCRRRKGKRAPAPSPRSVPPISGPPDEEGPRRSGRTGPDRHAATVPTN